MLTYISVLILVGTEIFGIALAGAWAIGGLFELQWRLLDREKAPFGLTLLAEPSFGFIDETSAERGLGRALETRLLFNKELVPEKLFAAFNVLYEVEKFRPRGVTLFSDEGEELDAPLAPCIAHAPKVKPALGEEAGEGMEAAEVAEEAKALHGVRPA
jgi:hypothetical protein